MGWALLLLAAAGDGVDVEVHARVDLRGVYRSDGLEEAAFLLDRAPTVESLPGDDFYPSVRAGVRGEASWRILRAAVGMEALPRRNGEVIELGDDPGGLLREAWLQAEPLDGLTVRAGVQPYVFQLRPPGVGEAMYLAPSESGSAWRPEIRDPAFARRRSNGRRAAAHPDVRTPLGGRVRYEFNPFLMAEGFWFDLGDGEDLGGVVADAAAGERVSLFVLGTYGTGPWAGSRLETLGVGADVYLDRERRTELFGELYRQWGQYTDRSDREIRKSNAWAMEGGVRRYFGDFWVEASRWAVTGDRSPEDGHDSSFQSYGDVRQFLVVEDPTFGLGVTSGYRAWKFAAGYGIAPAQAPLFLRVDVGFFDLDHPFRDRLGARLAGRESLGVEADVTARWQVHEHVAVQVRAGWLWDSGALEGLTGEREGGAVTLGPVVEF